MACEIEVVVVCARRGKREEASAFLLVRGGGACPFLEGSMGNTERTWTGYKIGMLFSLD
jgi:hypothetical protein